MSTTIKVCPVCLVSWYADKPEKHMMTCTAAAAAAAPTPPPWMVEPGKDFMSAPTEMETRVARALWDECKFNYVSRVLLYNNADISFDEVIARFLEDEFAEPQEIKQARAAIRAMHTPTTEMLREAGMAIAGNTEAHATVWEAMIDAASPGDE